MVLFVRAAQMDQHSKYPAQKRETVICNLMLITEIPALFPYLVKTETCKTYLQGL